MIGCLPLLAGTKLGYGESTMRPFRFAFLLSALLLALAGCAARPDSRALDPVAGVPGAHLVSVLVATNRAAKDAGDARVSALRYELLTVSIPPNHKPGEVEWSADAPGPAFSFATVRRQELSEAEFLRRATPDTHDIGVFVHGYNSSLPEAVFRLAQISHDARGDREAVLFSWPSEGALTGYLADQDAATFSRDGLSGLLRALTRGNPAGKIDLVGHSMGGWLVMESLRQLRLEKHDDVFRHLRVMLAAPDIDVDVFASQLDTVGKLSPPLTVLVSENDRALAASRRLSGEHDRIGSVDVRDPRVVALADEKGIAVVDISAVGAADRLGHNGFVNLAIAEGVRSEGVGLRRAGAFVFNTAGQALGSPFILVGRALEGE
ncbi:MAG: hypothetical protein DI629_05990 [Mesorhizobium amorphae]|nr:MAG: hypothetical protein DI629_05990 [Mesorhizobium amorphae]